MLPLPPGSEDPRELADWLELNAFLNKDGQASLDDLRDALRSGVLGYETGTAPQEQPEQLEQVAANVVVEISDRQRRARSGYPFKLRKSSLERTIRASRGFSSTYAFCLMLSYLPWDQQRMADCHPERIFEELSCSVAKEYVGGKAVRFGWPRARSVMPGGFGKAIAELCRRIGEGDGYLGTYSTGDEKDGAWTWSLGAR